MKRFAILLALAFCAALSGCNQASDAPSQESSAVITTPSTNESADATTTEDAQTATLYIGTKANGFDEYPMTYRGELTPDALIQGIADLTGWDLTLAEPVVSGKGGNPDALDIWYFMEGEKPLEISGLSWELDQPYQWESARRNEAER